jgi:hypothetical protein
VMFIVVKMEREIADNRFLTKRAGKKSRVSSWFSRLDAIVSISTGLCITGSPPEISFQWRCATMIVAFFVSRVEMCLVRTRRQFENSKLRLAKLLQPVKSVII